MLLYYLYKLYDLLLVKSTEVIPDIDIDFPNYHGAWENMCQGLGCFLPLTDLSKLFTIFITYQLIRIACSLRKAGKQIE